MRPTYREKLEFLWLYRAAWLEDVTVYVVGVMLWVCAVLILTACSYVTYEAKPDGSTIVKGYEIGTISALSGAKFSLGGDGSRSVEISGYNGNSVEGLREINAGMGLLIEGAVKGAK